MFRNSISIPSSRVKNPRTAQFLPTSRQKPEILLSCASGRTEKQTVRSFVHKPKPRAVLPEPYLHTICSGILCIIIPHSLYMHVIHTIYNSQLNSSTWHARYQELANLLHNVLYKIISVQFCKKKGPTRIILQEKHEGSSVLHTAGTLQERKSPTYLSYSWRWSCHSVTHYKGLWLNNPLHGT